MYIQDLFSNAPLSRGALHESVAADAKALFGITHNPLEAGYILADGSMLDLSGRHQVENEYVRHPEGHNAVKKPSGRDWMADQRSVDHREVNDLYELEHGTAAMRRFMAEAPALRFQPGNGFEANAAPTSRQLATALAAHFSISRDPAHVDVSDPQTGDTLASRSFSHREVRQAAAFIAATLGGTAAA